MINRSRLVSAAIASALIVPVIATTTPAAAACDPFTTPSYAGAVPSPQDVLGFPIGSQEVTSDEILTYLAAVDGASVKVATAQAATSVQGRPIRYAVVGHPDNVTPGALAELRAHAAALRDPALSASQAQAIAQDMPRILWLAGNVHGGEESGADASLQILYDLADRTDCAAQAILDGAVVFVMPTQNPDGREMETRRNAYAFDMNRDWFARTQPETDGKLEVLRDYPPMLFMDEHEFGYSNYLFPPHADPEYHETPDTAHGWIFDLYAPAMGSAFDREGLRYWHGAPYDFFATIFGDTAPAMGFHAAGMTFEKENDDPIADRTHEQYLAAWASLYAGATEAGLVADWRASFVEAYQEGRAGLLEPNGVYNEGSTLLQDVPDLRVRHYFLLRERRRAIELHELVRRLQRMDVDVYRLTAPLVVPDLRAYGTEGGSSASTTLPTGTYWIPMAQAQKHWIQSMLQDESWIPTDVTYDVTAWSNPQLLNLRGGSSGAVLAPSAALVSPLGPTPSPALPADVPSIGLFENARSTRGYEAAGHFRWLANERWHLPFTDVTPDDIRAGLPGIDVLVMPDGYAGYALQDLGAKGKRALREWVAAGGRLVAWQGGAEVAARAGVSTVVLKGSHTNMPGSLVRVALDPSSPLAAGVGATAWVMYDDDETMDPGLGAAASWFPAGAPVNGLAEGAAGLTGSAVVADERVGAGRVIAFAIDPNFRGWTLGTQRILWNALVGPDPAIGSGARLDTEAHASAVRTAKAAARALAPVGSSPLRFAVPKSDAAGAAAVVRDWGATSFRSRLGDDVLFEIANLEDLSSEEHVFGTLLDRLAAAGVRIRWASVP
jgi:hypothetical protein